MSKKRMARFALVGIPLMLFALCAFGEGRQPKSVIGPATTSVAAGATVSAAGSGVKNCITHVDLISTQPGTFRMLDGGTTFYSYTLAAASTSFNRSWSIDTAPCASANADLTVKFSTTSAGTFELNYGGFSF